MSVRPEPFLPPQRRHVGVGPLQLRLATRRSDVTGAVTRYRRIGAALPGTAVHYVVGTDPDPHLLRALGRAGCRFTVSDPDEVVAALRAGAAPGDLLLRDPASRLGPIRFAGRLGVRTFVVRSVAAVRCLASTAPGASVLVAMDGVADGPRRGCSPELALHVLRCAARLRLDPAGVSLTGPPETRPPSAWAPRVALTAEVFGHLRRDGVAPWLLDLGDGFPSRLDRSAAPLASYGAAIETALRRSFPDRRPRTIVTPGRAVATTLGSDRPGVGG